MSDPRSSMAFPPSPVPVVPHRDAPVGPLRHLLSAVVAVLLVPLAFAAIDDALSHGLSQGFVTYQDGLPPVEALGPFMVGLLLLFTAAATGRISAVGPLLAGLAWGVMPAVVALTSPSGLTRAIRNLPELYDQLGYGLVAYGIVVFPITAVLLLGAAVAGRWR